MAISVDNSADLGGAHGVSSRTVSFTVKNGATFLLAFVLGDQNSDLLTSVTYGGKTMTQLAKKAKAGGIAAGYLYAYGLYNPPSGTNNIVVSASSSCSWIAVQAISYFGCGGALTYQS